MTIKLLDCTLRDGGYVNGWNFGKEQIFAIFRHLQDAKVDIIEIGFLNDGVKFCENKSISPTTRDFDMFFSGKEKSSMTVAMVNFGNCRIENIFEPNFLDGIRIIFKKYDINHAIEYCRLVKDLGYKVFIQPVSITAYSDCEMLNLIEKVNSINPYSMSIVDTYGLMHKDQMIHYFNLMNDNLDKSVKIDYHSHNNLQLAYSNAIEFVNLNTKRDLIMDASLYGMGKNAGNTCVELIAMYLNNYFNKNYNLDEILFAINNYILKYKSDSSWGYCLPYFVSALNCCNSGYVDYLKKQNFNLVKINDILKNLNTEKKLVYDEDYIKNYISSLIN